MIYNFNMEKTYFEKLFKKQVKDVLEEMIKNGELKIEVVVADIDYDKLAE